MSKFMKSILIKSGILLFMFPASVFANPLCEPLESVRSRVNYCDENLSYVAPARSCRDKYLALVKERNAEVGKALSLDVKNRKGDEQEADFQTTQTVLATARDTLNELITSGKQTLAEIEAYAGDFVLPIYDGYEEDYNLDPAAESTQKIFREKNCYGEPMEDLDGMKNELKQTIAELELTKSKVHRLHDFTREKEGRLDSLSSGVTRKTAGIGSPADKPARKKKRKASTITGVEEDLLKQKQ